MRFSLLVLAGLTRSFSPGAAQEAPSRLPGGTAAGATVGVLTGVFTTPVASLHVIGLKANRSSQAFSLHLLPEAWGGGIFVFLPDFSLTYNVSRPDATLVLKAGPSVPLAIGQGFALTFGIQAGAAVVGRIGARAGLLVDVTPHFFFGGDEVGALVTIGFGLVALPKHASDK